MKKCNLCYDRTVQGLQPWCAQTCPTDALWYGTFEEFNALRNGEPVSQTQFGEQGVRTRVFHVLPEGNERLDVIGVLQEAAGDRPVREEAWVL